MAEDFNKLRLLVHNLVTTDFKQSWEFSLEIEKMPEDLDIYVKDITYGPTEISNEPIKIGSRTLTFPIAAEPVSLSMTVRDHRDERVSKAFDLWAGEVVFLDGTVGLPHGPNGYIRKCKRFGFTDDGKNDLRDTWEMMPVQRGDVTESREEGSFLEFPMTFIQFKS